VLCPGEGNEVIRPDAPPVSASMMDVAVVGDRTDQTLVHKTMPVQERAEPTVSPDALRATVRLAPGWTAEPADAAAVTDASGNAVTRENAGDRLRLALRVTRDDDALDWLDRLRGTP